MNPIVQKKLKTVSGRDVLQFGGLNLLGMPNEGEIIESRNMSNRDYPRLSTRLGRYEKKEYPGDVQLWTAGSKLITVNSGTLYADYAQIRTGLNERKKIFANLGSRMVLLSEPKLSPVGTADDKIMYNTKDGTITELQAEVVLEDVDFIKHGTEYYGFVTTGIVGDPVVNLSSYFKVGDTIRIEGAVDNAGNNGYYTILEMTPDPVTGGVLPAVGTNYIYINGERGWGTAPESGTITISRRIPEFTLICGHQNRLWGIEGDNIMCSAPLMNGNVNFDRFLGDEADSWFGAITSAGEFTGIVSWNDMLLCFKENSVIKIVGTDAMNYQIREESIEGVRRGCGKSLCQISGRLFWLGANGILSYGGDIPQNMSLKLNYPELTDGLAVTDGRIYMLCCTRPKLGKPIAEDRPEAAAYEKEYANYVFETRFQTWIQHDNVQFTDFCNLSGRIYGAVRIIDGVDAVTGTIVTHSVIYVLEQGTDDIEELTDPMLPPWRVHMPIEWEVTFAAFNPTDLKHRVYSRVTLEYEMGHDSEMEVLVSYGISESGGRRTVEGYGDDLPILIANMHGKEKVGELRELSIVPARKKQLYITLRGKGLVTIRGIGRTWYDSTSR